MICRSHFRRARALSLLVLVPAMLCQGQPGQMVGWGTPLSGPSEPKPGNEYMSVCCGGYHSLALTAAGTLVAWGENSYGQCDVPAGSGFVAIAAGLYHNLALRADGTVVAWGDNTRGQCNVPPRTKFLAIGAGTWHSLGVRQDGSLVAWGWNESGQCSVPPGHDYIDVTGGYYHSLARKADRSLVAWGGNGDGQCNVPAGNDFVRIASGWMHSIALRADGTIVAWGRSGEGQCNVPAGSDFVAIAAGAFHNLALQTGGHVEAWGQNEFGQCDTPEVDNVAAVAAGKFHSLAIRDNRPSLPLPLPVPERIKTSTLKPVLNAKERGVSENRTSPVAAEETRVLRPAVVERPAIPATDTSANPGLIGSPKPEPPQATPLHPAETPATSLPKDRSASTTRASSPEPEPTQIARPHLAAVVSEANQPKSEGTGTTPPSLPKPQPTQAAQRPQVETLKAGTADTGKTDVNRPADHVAGQAAKATDSSVGTGNPATPPGKPSAQESPARSKSATVPAKSGVPTGLNDPARQGLAADIYLNAANGDAVMPVYHFASTSSASGSPAGSRKHFFTIDQDEKKKLIDTQSDAWKYEGIAFFAYPEGRQPPGARPVYRLLSPSRDQFFFTMDETQKQMLIDEGWQDLTIAWYAPAGPGGAGSNASKSRTEPPATENTTVWRSAIVEGSAAPSNNTSANPSLTDNPGSEPTQATRPLQTQPPQVRVPQTSSTPTQTTDPNHPANPAAKPGSPSAQGSATPSTPVAKPAVATAEPNIPLGLNNPARPSLSPDLYLDVSGSAVPVYHFTSIAPPGTATTSKQHFCTIDEQEKYKLIDTQPSVWKYEGIAFFAYPEGRQPPGARPVYRFWSQSLNRYYFTMDEAEKQVLLNKFANAWKYQGVAWYGPPPKTSKK